MTMTTPNGWAVLQPGSKRLHAWSIPGAQLTITARNDHLGFLVAFWVLFWHEKVESLRGRTDVGCWSYRDNTTAHGIWSEHAAAAAVDCAWRNHPQGSPIAATFTAKQIAAIRRGVRWLNRLALGKVAEWGGEWPTHPRSKALTDGMHVQFHQGRVLFLVRRVLVKTARGKRILAANPWFRL